MQVLAQLWGCFDDDLLEVDHRCNLGLHRDVLGDLDLADGLVGALRLEAQGESVAGRAGLWAAVAGLVGLAADEISSGLISEGGQ